MMEELDKAVAIVRQGSDYERYFHPATYLAIYETPAGPEAAGDWGNTMTGHWKQAFSGVSGERLLDVGCGPSIHAVIPASQYFSEIILADYAACNRQALKDWINKRSGAHDWGPFFEYWAEAEDHGQCSQEIEQRVRGAIKSVMVCDITKENPLHPEAMTAFDCVMTNLCLEAAAASEEVYRQVVKNVVELLKPGGHFLVSGALNQTEYYVGDEVFYCLSVNEALLRGAVEDSGCHIDELHIHSVNPEAAELADLSAYFFLVATKKAT